MIASDKENETMADETTGAETAARLPNPGPVLAQRAVSKEPTVTLDDPNAEIARQHSHNIDALREGKAVIYNGGSYLTEGDYLEAYPDAEGGVGTANSAAGEENAKLREQNAALLERLAKYEQGSNDGQTGSTSGTPLPDSFPKKTELAAAGYDTVEAVRGIPDVTKINGIGQASVQPIADALASL